MVDKNIDAVPLIPESEKYEGATKKAIKAATPDLIIFDENINSEEVFQRLTSLIFEQIGGQELINIARNDIINGQKISYNIISNVDQINYAYNSKNIFTLPGAIESFFKNFSIRLDTHIPERGTGPQGQFVYVDRENIDPSKKNRLTIDVVNMAKNEKVEIQVLNFGIPISDILDDGES